MTDAAPASAYAGLHAGRVRAAGWSADLRAQGLLRGRGALHPHRPVLPPQRGPGGAARLAAVVLRHDQALAEPAIAAVEEGRVRFTPAQVRARSTWTGCANIRPWCVSRQLWWGHQLPVWYRGDEVHVGASAPEGEGWERDPDVLDTWFSSALWPFATLGWPEETPELERFYPTQVLSTARDIIFLWVARMVMMGIEYMGEEPVPRRLHPLGHPGRRTAGA